MENEIDRVIKTDPYKRAYDYLDGEIKGKMEGGISLEYVSCLSRYTKGEMDLLKKRLEMYWDISFIGESSIKGSKKVLEAFRINYEDLPLLINDESSIIQEIANWRLKLGK